MALDYWQYSDPLEVVIRKEEQTCKGCIYEETLKAFNREVTVCTKNMKHIKRCRYYLPSE